MLASAYRLSEKLRNKYVKLVSAVHQGIWLGILSDSQLQSLTTEYYDRHSRYIDLEHNAKGLFEWEERLIGRYFPPGTRVLVAAAGSGREIIALAHRGYEVDGFDCNAQLVRAGQELLKAMTIRATLLHAPPGAVITSHRTYDGVIIGWGGYMHVVGRERRVMFLKCLRGLIKSGSPLLLSVFAQSKVSTAQTLAANIANKIRFFRGGSKIVSGDWISGSFDHHFTQEELESELRAAGFNLEFYEHNGYGIGVFCADTADQSD